MTKEQTNSWEESVRKETFYRYDGHIGGEAEYTDITDDVVDTIKKIVNLTISQEKEKMIEEIKNILPPALPTPKAYKEWSVELERDIQNHNAGYGECRIWVSNKIKETINLLQNK